MRMNFGGLVKEGVYWGFVVILLIIAAGSFNILPGAKATDDPRCDLDIYQDVDKSEAGIGELITYTLHFSNLGNADCTGGVRIEETVNQKLIYKREIHSDNVSAGYEGIPVYNDGSIVLVWDADVLEPGETGSVSWTAEINNEADCGAFNIDQIGSITSREYSGFNNWVHSNAVNTVSNKACPSPDDFNFSACESLLSAPGDKAHYETGWHQIVGGSLLEGSDDVYSLKENNYTQCFCPLEGDKGIQSNWLRTDRSIDGWFFVNGTQWDLGDFNYAVQNLDFNCNPTPLPPISVPDIQLTKTASPSVLPAEGGQVSYMYQVTNTGDLELSDITLVDDKCGSIVYVSGDTDDNDKLGVEEVWMYNCSVNLTAATTNTAIASGKAEGETVEDTATASVTISSSGGGGGSNAVISGGGGGGGGYNPPSTSGASNAAFKITKTPYPSVFPSGGGIVTYTYQVINMGNVPFSQVVFSDDRCDVINLIGGDANINQLLDVSEIWTYTCQTDIKATTVNNVTVRVQAGDVWLTDMVSATVRVGEPVIPKYMPRAGGGGIYSSLMDLLEQIISGASYKLDQLW